MKKFYHTFSGMKRGRPKSSTVLEAMSHAFNYLEQNREECQFTFSEIFSDYEGELPTDKTIKSEMIERYGHDIVISVNKNRKPVVCFRDTGNKIQVPKKEKGQTLGSGHDWNENKRCCMHS